MQGFDTVAPFPGQQHPIFTFDIVAARRENPVPTSKPVAKMMQSTGYSSPLAITLVAVIAVASAFGIHQFHVRAVEGRKVGVVKTGAFTELAIVGFERLGSALILDDCIDSSSDLLHLLEISELHEPPDFFP